MGMTSTGLEWQDSGSWGRSAKVIAALGFALTNPAPLAIPLPHARAARVPSSLVPCLQQPPWLSEQGVPRDG